MVTQEEESKAAAKRRDERRRQQRGTEASKKEVEERKLEEEEIRKKLIEFKKKEEQRKRAEKAAEEEEVAAVKRAVETVAATKRAAEEAAKRKVGASGPGSALSAAKTDAKEAGVSPRLNSSIDIYLRQARSQPVQEDGQVQPTCAQPKVLSVQPISPRSPDRTSPDVNYGQKVSPSQEIRLSPRVLVESNGKLAAQGIRQSAQRGPTPEKETSTTAKNLIDFDKWPQFEASSKPLTFNPDVEPLTFSDVLGQLKGLVSWFDQGVVSSNEFEHHKAEILEKSPSRSSSRPVSAAAQETEATWVSTPRQTQQGEATFKDFVGVHLSATSAGAPAQFRTDVQRFTLSSVSPSKAASAKTSPAAKSTEKKKRQPGKLRP